MLTPVAQRQVFATAHVEATRLAHEVAEQFQREMANRLTTEAHLAEARMDVHQVPESERLRSEARQHGRGEGWHGGQGSAEEDDAAAPDPAQDDLISGPDHLDLLA